MSFPVPVKYNLTDDKNETVVVYNNGREENLLPDPGCFSQKNINIFADRWIRGNVAHTVIITNPVERNYGFSAAPFNTVFYLPSDPITRSYVFQNPGPAKIIIPLANLEQVAMFASSVYLTIVDLGTRLIPASTFLSCRALKTVILRLQEIVDLDAVNAFNGSPYASGGSGGEIYIPKNLYDHLGDGSALDYKAAANWSTIDGYGTITWRQIEGSEYEFNYADGTPIGSV